jgi:tetratricopeptide (TPR) repeat protein
VLLAEILATSPGGHDEAIRQATKAIVADPVNAMALDLRAGLLIKKGLFGQAAADLMRAKEIDPFGVERLVTLGNTLADLERYGQAEAILREALKAIPNSSQAKIALGKALLGLQKYDDVVKFVSSAMQNGTNSGDAYRIRGQASIALDNYRDGLRDLEAAVRLGLKDAQSRIILARIYATTMGTKFFDPGKALSHASIAVDLTKRQNADALAALGVAYAASNEFVKAAIEMRQAFALAPHMEEYRKLLAEYKRKAR